VSTSVSDTDNGVRRAAEGAAFSIVLALGFSHFLNDTIQSLVPSLYPMLKQS
jgi:FSR family fosmidomycin resistance protein-like MFS transporter